MSKSPFARESPTLSPDFGYNETGKVHTPSSLTAAILSAAGDSPSYASPFARCVRNSLRLAAVDRNQTLGSARVRSIAFGRPRSFDHARRTRERSQDRSRSQQPTQEPRTAVPVQ